MVFVVNKWDLIEKTTQTAKEYEDKIRQRLAPFKDVPILFVSVHEKQRVLKAVEVALEVAERRKQKISTRALNDFFLPLVETYPPPAIKGKHVKIKFVTQMKGIPMFIFFCNMPQYVYENYNRFLENKMREHFNYTGVPLQLVMRKK